MQEVTSSSLVSPICKLFSVNGLQGLFFRAYNVDFLGKEISQKLCDVNWAGLDSNQRRLTPTGLQPVPFSHSGTDPEKSGFTNFSSQQCGCYYSILLCRGKIARVRIENYHDESKTIGFFMARECYRLPNQYRRNFPDHSNLFYFCDLFGSLGLQKIGVNRVPPAATVLTVGYDDNQVF